MGHQAIGKLFKMCITDKHLTTCLTAVLMFTMFASFGCSNYEDERDQAKANQAKFSTLIDQDPQMLPYLDRVDPPDWSNTMILEVDTSVLSSESTFEKFIGRIRHHADNCLPLHFRIKQDGRIRVARFKVEINLVHERGKLQLASLVFDSPNSKNKIEFDRARAKLESLRSEDVWHFLQDRWDYYESRDGDYLPEHDSVVLLEGATAFGLSVEDIFRVFSEIEAKRIGLKPKRSISLSDQNTPVKISIQDVFIRNSGILCVTVRNETKWNGVLPTINLTCNTHKVIWVEELGYGDTETNCSMWSIYQDYVDIVAYINIDEMRNNNLKSSVQESNDIGWVVIPILKEKRYKIRK